MLSPVPDFRPAEETHGGMAEMIEVLNAIHAELKASRESHARPRRHRRAKLGRVTRRKILY